MGLTTLKNSQAANHKECRLYYFEPVNTGCPNNHGNKMTISISSLFHAGLIRKYNCVLSQFKHLETEHYWTRDFQNVVYYFFTLTKFLDTLHVYMAIPDFQQHPA